MKNATEKPQWKINDFENVIFFEDLKDQFEKYDKCKHFVVPSADDYDWYDSHHDFDYGCIKCGLNTNLEMDLPLSPMREYFKVRGTYLFYITKHMIQYKTDLGSLESSFIKLCEIYNEEIKNNYPNISNAELDTILKNIIKKNDEEIDSTRRKNVKFY